MINFWIYPNHHLYSLTLLCSCILELVLVRIYVISQQISTSSWQRKTGILWCFRYNLVGLILVRINVSTSSQISAPSWQEKQVYSGASDTTFKEQHRNHTQDFYHKRYSKCTEFLKYIWQLKRIIKSIVLNKKLLEVLCAIIACYV